jgi:hypothetical protein
VAVGLLRGHTQDRQLPGNHRLPAQAPKGRSRGLRAGRNVQEPEAGRACGIEHARSLATGGNLDQACALAVTAYDIGCNYESERVRQAVREFRASLDGRNGRHVTAELDERLHSAYSQRAKLCA